MEHFQNLSMPLAAAIIFFARILDVSLGTIRTISTVNGRLLTAVVPGFFEILIWISVVSHMMFHAATQPFLLFAYAGGFAAGNAVGILIERRLAIGTQVLRLISTRDCDDIANAIREIGQAVTVLTGEGRDGPVKIFYVTCPRKRVPKMIALAKKIDPKVFFVVESVVGLRRNASLAKFESYRNSKTFSILPPTRKSRQALSLGN